MNVFDDMDDCVNKFFRVIDNLTEDKMDKPKVDVIIKAPHHNVIKDGEIVKVFNDILNPNALTDAYALKGKLEKGNE